MHGDFEFIQHEQRSEEWHLWRAAGFGASDAAALLGRDPFRSKAQLIEEKLNPRFRRETNAAMQFGLDNERLALAWYRRRRNCNAEATCVQSNLDPWLRASIDGLDLINGTFVEIKCGPGIYNHAKKTGRIYENVYLQIQHTLAITGLDVADFLIYLPTSQPLMAPIFRNDEIIEAIRSAAKDTWDEIGERVILKIKEFQTSSTNRP